MPDLLQGQYSLVNYNTYGYYYVDYPLHETFKCVSQKIIHLLYLFNGKNIVCVEFSLLHTIDENFLTVNFLELWY